MAAEVLFLPGIKHMKVELVKEFTFEAAHHLPRVPEGHKCRLLHGHGYRVEIAIFGIAPKFIGKGYGGALLTAALEEAWRGRPNRVWLHTCTLDHHAALPNYLARGMTVYRVEEASAPRAAAAE